jgi:hypothetical protein
MASLLNNASLLLNPAGSIISYQEDKIYSVLPKMVRVILLLVVVMVELELISKGILSRRLLIY